MDKTVLNIIGTTLAIAACILFFSAIDMFTKSRNPFGQPWTLVTGILMFGSGIAAMAAAANKPKG